MTSQPHQHDEPKPTLHTALWVIPDDMLAHVFGGDASPTQAVTAPVVQVPPVPLFPGW